MNKVILVGRLTKDPEVRYSQSAEPLAVAKFALAVSRRSKREGEPDADFINCVVFGKQAEFAEKYFKKGMMAALSGRLQIRQYDDQNGTRHWMTEVLVDDLEFAESRSSFESRTSQSGEYQRPAPANNQFQNTKRSNDMVFETEGFSTISQTIDDEDLPF